MSIERRQITVAGLPVQVVRKPIKNLHLGVYPPNGRIRVAAPLSISDSAVRLAVVNKLGWIKRQQNHFRSQPRQTRREMVSGETHYFLGRRYRLRVSVSPGSPVVKISRRSHIDLQVPKNFSVARREAVLLNWYRLEMQKLIPPLITRWQQMLSVHPSGCSIRRMKTKWGSCNPKTGHILLNLELAKKPVQCLEYIIAHELTHLLERHHNDRFTALMDKHLPTWRTIRAQLNAEPLSHANWSY